MAIFFCFVWKVLDFKGIQLIMYVIFQLDQSLELFSMVSVEVLACYDISYSFELHVYAKSTL